MRGKICEYSIIYTLGAMGYGALEIFWRGYSHWTMTVTGGACFMMIYFFNRRLHGAPVLKKSAICAAGVTAVEFAVGCVVNLLLKWDVWDYSGLPFSVYGQICIQFCALWFLLCIPLLFLSEALQRRVFTDFS